VYGFNHLGVFRPPLNASVSYGFPTGNGIVVNIIGNILGHFGPAG
jgi:hypothetical protein